MDTSIQLVLPLGQNISGILATNGDKSLYSLQHFQSMYDLDVKHLQSKTAVNTL